MGPHPTHLASFGHQGSLPPEFATVFQSYNQKVPWRFLWSRRKSKGIAQPPTFPCIPLPIFSSHHHHKLDHYPNNNYHSPVDLPGIANGKCVPISRQIIYLPNSSEGNVNHPQMLLLFAMRTSCQNNYAPANIGSKILHLLYYLRGFHSVSLPD